MIKLLSPADGATLSVLSDVHREFLKRVDDGTADRDVIDEDDWVKRYPWLPGRRDPERNMTEPAHVLFTWRADSPLSAMKLEVSEDVTFSAAARITKGHVFQSAEDGRYFSDAYNFKSGTAYYWRVRCGEETSGTFSFTTEEGMRPVGIPGCANARDLGGVTVSDGRRIKQGLVFRGSACDSNEQEQYSVTDEGKRVFIHDLGIKTELDLRRGAGPTPFADCPEVDVLSAHMHGYVHSFTEEDGRKELKKAFGILADPRRYPVYIHCQAGADRTGTLIYTLQALLGMRQEDMIRDYDITSLSVEDQRNWNANVDLRENVELFRRLYPDLSFGEAIVKELRTIVGDDSVLDRIRDFLLE